MSEHRQSRNPADVGFGVTRGSVLACLILVGGLGAPLAAVIDRGITLTGSYEESIGYRYFYTLRQVYDGNPYVFLPQGQLIDVAHQFIQLLLTALGHGPTSLFPRIDLFSYAALAAAYLGALAAFIGSGIPLRRPWFSALAAVWLLLPYYSIDGAGYWVILQPDYHNWILPTGLSMVAVFARWDHYHSTPWTLRGAICLGAFAAAAMMVKPTLVVYALTLAVAFVIARPDVRNSLAKAAAAVVTAAAGVVLILSVLYQGKVSYLILWLRDEIKFLRSATPGKLDYWSWVARQPGESTLATVMILAPLIVAVAVFVARRRRVTGPLIGVGLAALLYQLILYSRSTSATRFEVETFLQCATLSVLLITSPVGAKWSHTAYALAAALPTLLLLQGITYVHGEFLSSLERSSRVVRKSAQLVLAHEGRTVFLIPDNAYRPLTSDSAIMKGSKTISWQDVESPLLQRMFGSRFYPTEERSRYRAAPLDLRTFGQVVIAFPKSKKEQTVLRYMEEYYSTSLAEFTLYESFELEAQYVNFYRRGTGSGLNSLGVGLAQGARDVHEVDTAPSRRGGVMTPSQLGEH